MSSKLNGRSSLHDFYARTVRRLTKLFLYLSAWRWREKRYVLKQPTLSGHYPPYRYTRTIPSIHKYIAGGLTAFAVTIVAAATFFASPDMHTYATETNPGTGGVQDNTPFKAATSMVDFSEVSQSPDEAAQKQTLAAPAQPIVFGMGAQMEGVLRERLYREAPVKLLTSWYNSPADLQFMRPWAADIIPKAYAEGNSLHLIVWTGDEERQIDTKYGSACGRGYPLSAGFADDMKQLATTFNGSGTLYVSMFTEFQTYPCEDNMWQGSANYYRALQDQYRLAQSIFKAAAPNSKISLTWGGWQAAWDDQDRGGGRSLMPHFADVMRTSDFQSFQAMDSSSNVAHINDMTRLLHAYGVDTKKSLRQSIESMDRHVGLIDSSNVMVAHYKPDNSNQNTWESDLSQIFAPANLAQLKSNGLFAFSFMDEKNVNATEASFQQARQAIETYAR